MRIEQVLSKAANELANAEEGIACAGTALESKTFKVGGKAFLFIGPKNARLKLAQSGGEAKEWAAKSESAVEFGTGGWVAIRFDGGVRPSDVTLRRWVGESYAQYQTCADDCGNSRTKFNKPSLRKNSNTSKDSKKGC